MDNSNYTFNPFTDLEFQVVLLRLKENEKSPLQEITSSGAGLQVIHCMSTRIIFHTPAMISRFTDIIHGIIALSSNLCLIVGSHTVLCKYIETRR